MRLRRVFTPARLLAAGAFLAVVTLFVLWLAPSNDYLLLPNGAHPVAPLVTVQTPKPGGGKDGIHFVDIIERKATLLESLFPGIRDGSTKVSGSTVNPLGLSESVRTRENLQEMARSQEIAAAVALRALGYRVRVREMGALVVGVLRDLPSDGKLYPGDVLVGVGDKPVHSPTDLQRLVRAHGAGDPVRLTVSDGKRRRVVEVTPTVAPHDPARRPVIGVLVEPAARIHLPIRVRIDTGNVGGPSAGLAFALDLMEKLGRDVDHGHEVAATGEIFLDGAVGPIGGIKQKTIGARTDGIDVFLVPRENAAEARRFAKGMRVIAVGSFREALRKLAALPRSG